MSGRDQHHHHSPVNPAAQKAHRGWRMTLAATVLIATKAMAIDFQADLGSAAGLALVFGAMELATAAPAALNPHFFRKLAIDFFQEAM